MVPVSQTFGPSKIHVPKAPALGLLLEQPQFGVYNSRVDQSNTQVLQLQSNQTDAEKGRKDNDTDADTNTEAPDATAKENTATLKDKLDFEPHRALIDTFKKDYIYTSMRQEEAQSRMYVLSRASV